jgi:hypothetical protein
VSDNNTILCHKCNKDIEFPETSKVLRSDECPHCAANIYCCLMCKFYDKSSYNECREPTADRIVDKEKANYCDFYILTGVGNRDDKQNELFDTAASLFKN